MAPELEDVLDPPLDELAGAEDEPELDDVVPDAPSWAPASSPGPGGSVPAAVPVPTAHAVRSRRVRSRPTTVIRNPFMGTSARGM